MLNTDTLDTHNKAFFWQWIRSPKEVGAIFPSSSSLAQAMAAQVPICNDGTVLELGAGTGAITKALLQAGIRSDQLMVMEKNPSMADTLHQRFPNLCILQKDVTRLSRAVHDARAIYDKREPQPIKTIVSGLPMLLFDSRKQYVILRQAFSLLAPGGFFIQFTYGPTPPVSRQVLARLGIKAKRAAFIWRNTPPAAVWKLELSPTTIAQSTAPNSEIRR